MKEFFNKYSSWIIAILIGIIVFFWVYFNKMIEEKQKKIDEVEYVDTSGIYHKIYYEKKYKELSKENKALYDSLKQYKNKLDYIVQFYHEKEYNTGQITTKPKIKDSTVYDTIPVTIPQVARTYEYTSEPNDTFQYKLNVNSFTEPNWYLIQAKVKNKFTIVNKEENGVNHITIKPGNGGTITDPTVFKKKKNTFWNRFTIGPGATVGYDPINKQWGATIGLTCSYKIN